MKKMNRILSFVLVITLLFTSLSLPSGATLKTGTSVDPDAEVFTPTANFTQITTGSMGQTYMKAIQKDGSKSLYHSWINMLGDGNLDGYYVEPDGNPEYGVDPYILFAPSQAAITGDGGAKLKQHNYVATNKKVENISYASNAGKYFFWEADIATESTYLPFSVSIVTRIQGTSTSYEKGGPINLLNAGVYDGAEAGRFHRLTVVGDFNNNAMYIYLDGEYKTTHVGIMHDTGYDDFKNKGTAVYTDGLRFQIPGSLNFKDDASYAIKHINADYVTIEGSANSDGTARLDVIGSHVASSVSGYEGDLLPYMVEINGVKYNNTVDASKALNTYKANNKANALRAFYGGYITVGAEAVINTYSATNFPLRAGAGIELTKSTASTWIATPTVPKYTTNSVEAVPADRGNMTLLNSADAILNIDGNIINGLNIQTPNHSLSFNVMETLDGERYLYTYDAKPDEAMAAGDHEYVNATLRGDFDSSRIDLGKYKYITFDMDIFAETEFINFYSNFNTRDKTKPNSKGGYDALTSTQIYLDQIPVTEGEWNHLAFVGEVQTNKLYVLLNGVKVSEVNLGLYPKDYSASNVILESFRTIQVAEQNRSGKGDALNGRMSVVSDNYCMRVFEDAASVEATSVYGDGYQFPVLPVLAEVDGVSYYNTKDVELAVRQNFNDMNVNMTRKDVTFYYQFHGKVTFDGRATVDENGTDSANFGCTEQCVWETYTDEGGILHVEVYKNSDGVSRENQTVLDLKNSTSGDAAAKHAAAANKAYDFINDPVGETSYIFNNEKQYGYASANLFNVNGDVTLPENAEYVTSEKNGKSWTFLRLPAGANSFGISRTESTPATPILEDSSHYLSISFDVAFLGSEAPSGIAMNVAFSKMQAGENPVVTDAVSKTLNVGNLFSIDEVGYFKHVTILFKSADTAIYDTSTYAGNRDVLKHVSNSAFVFLDNQLVMHSENFFGANATSELYGDTKYTLLLKSFSFTSSEQDDMLVDNLVIRSHEGLGTDFVLGSHNANSLLPYYTEFPDGKTSTDTPHPLYIDTATYSYPMHGTKLLGAIERKNDQGVTVTDVYREQDFDIMQANMAVYDYEDIHVYIVRTPSTPFTITNNAIIEFNGILPIYKNEETLEKYPIGDAAVVAARRNAITVDESCGIINGKTNQIIQVSAPYQSNVTNIAMPNLNADQIYKTTKYTPASGQQDNLFKQFEPIGYPGNRVVTTTIDGISNASYIKDYVADGIDLPNSQVYFNMYAHETYYDANTTGQYLAISFDFATNRPHEEYKIELKHVYSGGSSWRVFDLAEYIDDENIGFVHVVIIGDTTNNQYHLYINGEYKAALGAMINTSNPDMSDYYFALIRFGPSSLADVMYDNMYIRIEKNIPDFTIGESGTLEESLNHYGEGYIFPDARAIASVDGKYYYSVKELESVLVGDYIKEVVLFQALSNPITISCPAIVETHRLADDTSNLITTVGGYEISSTVDNAELKGSLTVNIQKSSTFVNLTIKVTLADGSEQIIVQDSVPKNTDVEKYLEEHSIKCDSIIVSGDVYDSVSWGAIEKPSGVISEDTLFAGTAGQRLIDAFIMVDNSGKITTCSSEADFRTMLQSDVQAGQTSTLVLNQDLTLPSSQVIGCNGEKNIYLNGHTIKSTSSSHGIIPTGNGNITIWGGGGVLDLSSVINAQAAFYTNTGYCGTVAVKNATVNSSAAICEIRDGNISFEGCNINSYMMTSNNCGFFNLGIDWLRSETDHVHSTAPMSLTLKDCNISARFNTSLYDKYNEASYNNELKHHPLIRHQIVTANGQSAPDTNVFIENCNILSKGYLLNAYETAGSVQNAYDYSKLKIYVVNSSVHAKGISSNSFKSGTLVFYDDVRTNITDTAGVSFVNKLTVAKTDNDMMPYLYTSHDYATVIWSDGKTTETWAAGSVPTNATFKFDSIGDIAAAGGLKKGETVELTKTMSSAPFSFLSNLSLGDYIGFNIYIPTSSAVSAVYINSKLIEECEILQIDGRDGDFAAYTARFDPKNTVRDFNIVIVLQDGKVMSRTSSITDHIKTLNDKMSTYGAEKQARNKHLIYTAMVYIQQSVMYSGYSPDMSEFMVEFGRISGVTLPTISGTESENKPSTHIESAQINLQDSAKFRFNLKKDGEGYYAADKFSFSFEGSEEGYDVTVAPDGSWIELSIRAYEMSRVITISYDGTEIGTYSLYDYYQTLGKMINGDDGYAVNPGLTAECKLAQKLVEKLWIYAEITDKYSVKGDE